MVFLHPENFKRLPLGYRPETTLRVSADFANKVRRIKKWGPRADDENIADVVTVLENMKTYTPRVFMKKAVTRKRSKRGLGRRRRTLKK